MLIATLIISSLCFILLFLILFCQAYHHREIKNIESVLKDRFLGTKNKLCSAIITRTWGDDEKHSRYKGVIFAVERGHIDSLYTTDWKTDLDIVEFENETIKKIFVEELRKNKNTSITTTTYEEDELNTYKD